MECKNFQKLPNKILLHTFSFAEPSDLLKLNNVSKQEGKYVNDGVTDDDWEYEIAKDHEQVSCHLLPKKKLFRTENWVSKVIKLTS